MDTQIAVGYARDPAGNMRVIRTEQSVCNRKGLKTVPMQGSVIAERYGGAEVTLYSDTAGATLLSVDDTSYTEQASHSTYYEAFIGYGATVEVTIKAKVTYGYTLYVRIKDKDGNVVGAEQATGQSSYVTMTFSWEELSTVGDTLSIEAYVSNSNATGTMYVESIKVKDPFARPTVEAEGTSASAALTTSLDTKGFPFLSYMYDVDGACSVLLEVSNDNSTWKTHTTHTAAGAEVNCVDLTCGFRYVRLKTTSSVTATFWLSAKR
jgi:hypothetical protein